MGVFFLIIGTLTLAYVIVKIMQGWTASDRKKKNADCTYENAPKPPGPWSWPIIGNAASLGDASHLVFDKMSRQYGQIFSLKIATMPVVVLNNMTAIRAALNRQKDTFSGRPIFPSNKLVSLGLGVAFNDSETIGTLWLERKARMHRCLHKYAVEKLDVITKHIEEELSYMVEALETGCAESPNGYVDPESVVRVSIGNALCAMCFGKRYQVNNAVSRGTCIDVWRSCFSGP